MRNLIIILVVCVLSCGSQKGINMSFGDGYQSFPEPGDSILVDSNFLRWDTSLLWEDSLTGGTYYYEHDSISGEIIFHPPPFGSLERVQISTLDTQKILGTLRTNETFLFLISGESNATGYGLNTDASAEEILPRFTQIWSPNLGKMTPLDIPLNQLGSVSTAHGFELQYANLVDSGRFGQVNTYITKAGEGSTRVAQWMPGSILYNRMVDRINSSISYLLRQNGQVTDMWLLWTQGINDMFDSKTPSSWKDSTLIIFNDLKFLFPNLKIAITKFNQPSYTTYNTVIQEIDDELNYGWSVDATGAGIREDNTHWDYQGNKTIIRRVVDIINAND